MFVYISIPVVFSLLTGSVVAGIASGVVYSLFGRMFSILLDEGGHFFDYYVYPVSRKILNYMFYYDTPQFEEFINSYSYKTSLGDVALSYAVTVPPCVLLLVIGFAALKRKED
jgi:hypothetical protein